MSSQFRFLSENEVFGDESLYIFYKMPMRSKITDFAILLGGYVSSKSNGCWWLEYDEINDRYKSILDNAMFCDPGNRIDNGGRPVTDLTSILENSWGEIINDRGIKEIKYGEYPQSVASEEISRKLENLYQKEKLENTGKIYRVGANNFIEYEFDSNKYIRVCGIKNIGETLSDGRKIGNYGAYWIKVEPITWLIDEKAGIALSKNILFAGIPYYYEAYNGLIEQSHIYNFMNESFAKDIIPSNFKQSYLNNKSEKLNDKSIKINRIIEEIESLLKYYYGVEDLKSKVKSIIDKYNDDIKESSKDEEFLELSDRLVLDSYNMDKESLYLKLVSDLEDILTSLKVSSEKYREYALMLELTQNALKVLDGNIDDEIVQTDEILKDLKTIKDTIIAFIENDEFLNELISVFSEYEYSIIDYLKGNEESSIKSIKTFNEFEIHIRRKMHQYLLELNTLVREKDTVNSIKIGYANMVKDLFANTGNAYVSNFYKELKSLIDMVNTKGTESDKKKLNDLLSKEIAFSNNAREDIKKLENLYISIYKIYLDILRREIKIREINEYQITLKKW